MNILLIGSGGREHALCYALKKSIHTEKLFCLPGNAGISELAECVNLSQEDFPAIAEFCKKNNIGLVVVGPEAPLVQGITDYLSEKNIKVFGPAEKAAALEGSKKFMKDLAAKYNIPTAEYKTFTDAALAKKFIKDFGRAVVIKADGLAAGKGVIVPANQAEALAAVDEIMGGKFGAAGNIVVVEEFMEGEEVSFFAISDGKNAVKFGSAQDHKRVGDNDTGPNTGGMGTYSPAPIMSEQLDKQVMEEIIMPTVLGMREEGSPFVGVLFAGLMLTKQGPKLLEFNIRFGDPETQSLMLRLDSDLVEIFLAAVEGNILAKKILMKDNAAVCVVMAANGYPGDYKKGSEIKNLDKAAAIKNAVIFHAGTKNDSGKILASGGRVLGVSATGKNIAEAKETAYKAVDIIDWKDGFCRRDIAAKAIK